MKKRAIYISFFVFLAAVPLARAQQSRNLMVIAESKPLAEILDMVKDFKKIVVAGCKGCVTVCNAGG